MNANQKLCLGIAGAVAVAASAYYLYKKVKKTESVKKIPLSDERDTVKEDLKSNFKSKIDLFDDEEDKSNEVEWIETDGVTWRKLTREEHLYGADYDPYSEDLVEELDNDGHMTMKIVKMSKPKLLNSRDDRAAKDIILSVDDMVSSISALNNNKMEYKVSPYDPLTLECLDYFIALCIYNNHIELADNIDTLALLSSYEYKCGGIESDIYMKLLTSRQTYFSNCYKKTYNDKSNIAECPFIRYTSVAELLIYLAREISLIKPDEDIDDIMTDMIDRLDISTDDRDVVINDIIISHLTHDRADNINYDDTYGLFGLTKEEYISVDTFDAEFELYLDKLKTVEE